MANTQKVFNELPWSDYCNEKFGFIASFELSVVSARLYALRWLVTVVAIPKVTLKPLLHTLRVALEL